MELNLRDHQLEVIQKLRDGFKQGHRAQLLYAPTGFGKTEVAIYLMKATAEKYNKAAILLDRLVLVARDLAAPGAPAVERLLVDVEGSQQGALADQVERAVQVTGRAGGGLQHARQFPLADALASTPVLIRIMYILL